MNYPHIPFAPWRVACRLSAFFLSVLLMSFAASNTAFAQQPVITNLQTEHLESPIGLDNPAPRFTWTVQEAPDGFVQSRYQLCVGTDSAAVASGKADIWDSGSINVSTQFVRYGGEELRPFQRYFWRVKVTDEAGREYTSPVARFEMGMMDMANWRGYWIGDGNDINHLPAPYFRKAFQVAKPVRSTRAYIAAAGLFELYVNGQRVGDHMLDPLYTRFDRRNLYVAHDVTSLLQHGMNAVGVVLGNGWYNHQAMGVWDFHNAPWRRRPTFCLDLRITYEDGTEQVIPTDLSWRTHWGEIVQNNIYTGEHRDFNRTQTGWATAQFDDSRWRGVGYRGAPSQNVTAQQARPIRVDWERQAVSLRQLEHAWVYDFGQNMSGVTHLRIKGKKGTVLRITCGERLDADGNYLDMSNIDVYYRGDREKDPFQTDVITLSGEEDEYTTQFNYKGFRYAEVSSSEPIELSKENLTACFVHSDVPKVGQITASNPIIEKLMHASRMSYLSNLMGLPTDCPQREKNGWTGDGHLAIEAGLYNYDGITVYEKWLGDHRDEQQPNGVLPDIIPTGGWGYGTDNGLDWTSTIAIIPWTLYLFYADDTALRQCYDNIRRYVDYVDKNYPSHLTTWGRGDWVPVSVGSNKEFTSSIFFYNDARILSCAAAMFGKDDDARKYDELAQNIRDAINQKYLNRETGIYASGTQTELSAPLYWGVVPEDMIEKVAANLNAKVEQTNYHLDVGVIGCKALLNALCQNGYAETAYRVAVQDTYPSWGWWVANGATTLLENWDLKATRDISDNHMMFGEIGAWFYKGLGGIYPDPSDPGFHHILLRPYFPQGLTSFNASHRSTYGEIQSGWTTKKGKLTYTAEVPANSYATLTLPNGWQTTSGQQALTLASGKHVLQLRKTR